MNIYIKEIPIKRDVNLESLDDIVSRIVEIKGILDDIKPLYEELDTLTLKIVAMWPLTREFNLPNEDKLIIQDNFAEKNTVFRPAGVKRFESVIKTKEGLEKSAKRNKKS